MLGSLSLQDDAAPQDSLPEDVVAHILAMLPAAHLQWAELVCRRFRAIVVQHELWRRLCLRGTPSLLQFASCTDPWGLDFQHSPSATVQQSRFWKRLCWRLGTPAAEESLIAEALAASSTDWPQESIDNVLNPAARNQPGQRSCYWSSSGSESPDAVHTLTFRLAHPLSLVTAVQIRPFAAHFQPSNPIYSARAVRFTFGGLDCFDAEGRPLPPAQLHAQLAALDGVERAAGWWQSREYDMRQEDCLQSFALPPTLCAGGLLRVELLGATQRQQHDELYYTCVCYLRAVGTPIYNFRVAPRCLPPLAPAAPPGAVLAAVPCGSGSVPAGSLAAACCSPGPASDMPPDSSQAQQNGSHGWLANGVCSRASGGSGGGGAPALCSLNHRPHGGQADVLGTGHERRAVLQYVAPDPLVAAGGLYAVSEGGRYKAEAQAAVLNMMLNSGGSDSGSDSEEEYPLAYE